MNYREVQYYTQVMKHKKLLPAFQLKMSILSFTMLTHKGFTHICTSSNRDSLTYHIYI